MAWHELPILKLAPKVTSSTQPKGDVNGKELKDGVIPNILETASLRVGTWSARRLLVPSAPLAPLRDPF